MTSSEGKDQPTIRHANKRGAARLAAVQALYQMDVAGSGLLEITAEYEAFRLGKEVDGALYREADAQWFRAILSGVVENQQELVPTLGLKLTNHWSVAASMRYDLDARFRIQDSFSLSYSDECFVLTTSYVETFVENTALDLRPDRTVMVRFALKHIGEFNYQTDQLNHVFGDQNLGAGR